MLPFDSNFPNDGFYIRERKWFMTLNQTRLIIIDAVVVVVVIAIAAVVLVIVLAGVLKITILYTNMKKIFI